MNKLPEIPSEYIEPYLVKFMGSMIEFIANACITQEELAERRGSGFTVAQIKAWVKGVEVFVSETCGIHARYAAMNKMLEFCDIPDDELRELCKKIVNE